MSVPDRPGLPTGPTPLASEAFADDVDAQNMAAEGGTLGHGSSGEAVKDVQRALVALGFLDAQAAAGEIGGWFGGLTANALAQFQRSAGITASGEIDGPTLRAIDARLRPAPPAAPRPMWNQPTGLPVAGAARMLYPETGGIAGEDLEFKDLEKYVGHPANVTVAIADTGTFLRHPLLRDNLVENGWDFVENKEIADVRNDVPGDEHGTHVAGIAAYGTDKVKILPLKVMTGAGGTEPALASAIDFARAHGARVVNMSIGGYSADDAVLLKTAIDRNPDLLIIASAGNFGANIDVTPSYPASIGDDNMLVVANVKRDGNLAADSDVGPGTVDVAAVGTDVTSASLPGEPGSVVAADGGNYQNLSGTSMAAPFVSNIAAKLFSLCPSLTALEAKKIILETCDLDPALSGAVRTGGVVDALGAYRVAAVIARALNGESAEQAAAELPQVLAEQAPVIAGMANEILRARPH
jgi:hypothetical protein